MLLIFVLNYKNKMRFFETNIACNHIISIKIQFNPLIFRFPVKTIYSSRRNSGRNPVCNFARRVIQRRRFKDLRARCWERRFSLTIANKSKLHTDISTWTWLVTYTWLKSYRNANADWQASKLCHFTRSHRTFALSHYFRESKERQTRCVLVQYERSLF